jgi:spore coat polysaccharide biosynthesis protein SpsF (cytidylyltransferase family)
MRMMSSALPRRLNHHVKLKGRALVVVQARLGSSRLPGKALLPIGNMPIVVLAAKRAGNTELPVRVATSSDRLDDPLVKALLQHGLEVKRGALDDVLGRFLMATEDLP